MALLFFNQIGSAVFAEISSHRYRVELSGAYHVSALGYYYDIDRTNGNQVYSKEHFSGYLLGLSGDILLVLPIDLHLGVNHNYFKGPAVNYPAYTQQSSYTYFSFDFGFRLRHRIFENTELFVGFGALAIPPFEYSTENFAYQNTTESFGATTSFDYNLSFGLWAELGLRVFLEQFFVSLGFKMYNGETDDNGNSVRVKLANGNETVYQIKENDPQSGLNEIRPSTLSLSDYKFILGVGVQF